MNKKQHKDEQFDVCMKLVREMLDAPEGVKAGCRGTKCRNCMYYQGNLPTYIHYKENFIVGDK